MKKQLLTIFLLVMILLPLPSLADDDKNHKEGTYLNISATERREIDEDLLVANLRYETEGQIAKEVQNKINKTMQKALERTKQLKDIKFSTEQYYVHKYHPRTKKGETRKTVWRGSQSLLIKGKSSKDILKLTGELQNMGFAVSGLTYTISPEKREEVRDSLMELAVAKLISKSKRVAKAIDKDDINIVTINVDADPYPTFPRPQGRMMSMDTNAKSELATPAVAPGQGEITMSVSATILIKD